MKQQLEQRLNELRDQFESGQKIMAELECKQANLRDTMLRISGAIQVLEELIACANIFEEKQGLTNQNMDKGVNQIIEMETKISE